METSKSSTATNKRSWRLEPYRLPTFLLLFPVIALLLLVYVIPLSHVFLNSLGTLSRPLDPYLTAAGQSAHFIVLIRTVRLSAEVAFLCLILGYPVAYLMLISTHHVRRIIALLVVSVLWTTVLVRTYAWMVILGREGVINQILQGLWITEAPITLLFNRFSVYIGMVHIMLPFMILPLYSVMQRIDMRLLLASRSLGATNSATFALIVFPLSIPGVFAGTLLVFILSMGFFVTPALLGGIKDITFVMLIERYVNTLSRFEVASAMSIVLTIITIFLVLIYQRILTANKSGEISRAASPHWLVTILTVLASLLGRLIRLGRCHRLQDLSRTGSAPNILAFSRVNVGKILGWTVILFMVSPVAVIFPLSFSSAAFLTFPPPGFSLRWYENYFSRSDWTDPTVTSLQIAFLTMIVATTIGGLASVALVRSEFPGKRLMTGFILSPMIVPTIVLAVAYYFLFASLQLIGTIVGLVLAHSVLAVPYVVIVISGALQSTGVAMERAAQTLGANPIRAFRLVTLPLIRPAVLTAALFSFLVSFEELVIALFISGVTAKTLPKRMWEGLREEIDPTIAAVAAIMVVVSLLLLFIAEIVRSRADRNRGFKSGPERLTH